MADSSRPERRSFRQRVRPVLVIALACFRADPRRSIITVLLRLTGAVSAPVFAAALASLVSTAHPGAALSASLIAAFILAAAVGAQLILDELGWKVSQVLEERTAHYVDLDIFGIVAGLPDLEHLESSDNLDRVERLRREQWLLSMSVPALVSNFALYTRMAASVGLLASVDPLLLLLLVFAVPSLFAGAKAERIRLAGIDKQQKRWRRIWDLFKLTARAPAKEVRVFGLGPEILRRHRMESDAVAAFERHDRLVGAALISTGRAFFALGYVGAIALVASRVPAGHMPVHDLVLTVVLAGQVMNSLQQATNNANWVAWTFTAVRRYVWLLDYAAAHTPTGTTTAPPAVLRRGISFEGVDFRYADRPTDALSEVDLFLPAGSTVAIVGDNGAGKTTLIKLLGRYYEPTGGRITIDGVDLSSLDVEAWRRRMTAAFQDHARLELRALDAIGAGDLERIDDEEAALEALDRAGASDLLRALPSGLATQLGPEWPGGIDLSGGEWQKVALGRGMMRETPLLLLLDEPTAALDAETEHRLFERYAAAAHQAAGAVGTITVLVSHRFSTVRMADLIVVLQGGHIVERGSHAELLAAGGLYAELFGMQARAYR